MAFIKNLSVLPEQSVNHLLHMESRDELIALRDACLPDDKEICDRITKEIGELPND